jgi:hypothetical protein
MNAATEKRQQAIEKKEAEKKSPNDLIQKTVEKF